jgi:hypothetical protein
MTGKGDCADERGLKKIKCFQYSLSWRCRFVNVVVALLSHAFSPAWLCLVAALAQCRRFEAGGFQGVAERQLGMSF